MVIKIGDKIKHVSTGDIIIVADVKSEKDKPYQIIDDKGTPWIIDFEILSRAEYVASGSFKVGDEIIVINTQHCLDDTHIKIGDVMTITGKDGETFKMKDMRGKDIFLCAKCMVKKQLLEPNLQNICKNKNVNINDLEEFF